MAFLKVKKGDRVKRLMAETVEVELPVVHVDERFIYCGPQEWFDKDPENCWMFDRETGVEYDPGLGWGVEAGVTGSRLTEIVRLELCISCMKPLNDGQEWCQTPQCDTDLRDSNNRIPARWIS